MRSSSEAALDSVRKEWDQTLAGLSVSLIPIGQELFQVSDAVAQHVSFCRGLTDASRTSHDREELARAVFATSVSAPVMTLILSVVSRRWSAENDVVSAFEELALQTLLASAQRTGALDSLEEELYRTLRLLRRERELRVTLGDRTFTGEQREVLARQVFTAEVPETLELVARAVHRAPEPTIVQSLGRYIEQAAERGKHLVASVTVASELTQAQVDRLTLILHEKYGADVAVHISVNPRVVGGMRIRVGEDVIDGTLETRITRVRDEITR